MSVDNGSLFFTASRITNYFDVLKEWETRSSYHKSLVTMFTREYQHLPEIRVLSSNLEERTRCKLIVLKLGSLLRHSRFEMITTSAQQCCNRFARI